MVNPVFKYILLVSILLIFIQIQTGYSQNTYISDIHAYIESDSLKIEIACEDFFRGKPKKALLAGIPASVEFEIRIVNERNKTVATTLQVYQITYEVWEEYFHVRQNQKRGYHFTSYEKLLHHFRQISNITIAPESAFKNEKYKLIIEFRMLTLIKAKNHQLRKWIEETTQTEEDLPSENRTTGFKVNLNRLISVFTDKSAQHESVEFVYKSQYFTVQQLETR